MIRAKITKSSIDQIVRPVSKFIHLAYTSGLALFLAVGIVVIWANAPLTPAYHHIGSINLSRGYGKNTMSHVLQPWINDSRMAMFFLCRSYLC